MAELEKLLSALIDGEGSCEQVSAAVAKQLTATPHRAVEVAGLIESAHERGLPRDAYLALKHVLDAFPGDGNDADPTLFGADDFGPRVPVSSERTQLDAALDDLDTEINTRLKDAYGAGETADPPDAGEDAGEVASGDGRDAGLFAGGGVASASFMPDPYTGAVWPTVVDRVPPSGATGRHHEFREGDLLRGRFELMSRLGEGGMGAVWKGKDHLKEEAHDRHPFVAIKLLHGDFSEHPEAFIALQRECAKQQRLAHPNIATVYDFDKDDDSGAVFMTMEVLEGQPLDAFIRKLPPGGMPPEEALPIIEQLCHGLAYAHGIGLVHSDLKPGNCFLTADGTVKLLDFGIARASKTRSDAGGEITLFDPREFGALTPTYASLEMFEGRDPDPRDDIYALAIMVYQLLTGQHPYGKRSAPQARDAGLKPAPVARLSRRQNRALLRGLALTRDKRTPSVERFLEELKGDRRRTPLLVAAGFAAAVVVAALAWAPLNGLIEKRERERVIETISRPGIKNVRSGLARARAITDERQRNRILDDPRTRNALATYLAVGGERTINEILALMAPFSERWQREVKAIERARVNVMDLYRGKIDAAFNAAAGRYDFAAASAHLDRLDVIYPDSAAVLKLRTRLNQEKADKLAELSERYSAHLDQGRLIPLPDQNDIGDIIDVVRRIDPRHPLLSDRRLSFRYGELAEAAIDDRAYDRAALLLEASQTYAPRDSQLEDLRFRVRAELQRIADARRVEEIERRLGARLASLETLADIRPLLEDLVVLSGLNPDSAWLENARAKAAPLFGAALDRRLAAGDPAGAEALLLEFSGMFGVAFLEEARRRIARAGTAPAAGAARQAAVDARLDAVNALISGADFSSTWETRLKSNYKALIALLPADNPALDRVRRQIAGLYVDKAVAAIASERFAEARAFAARGRALNPGLARFDALDRDIAGAEDEWRARREAARRTARIEALQNRFRAAVERNDVRDAGEAIDALRDEGVPRNDPFLAEEAPVELAGAYLRLAEGRLDGARPDYGEALALARKGLEIAPAFAPLRNAVEHYESEVARRRLETALRKRFEDTGAIDVAATRRDLATLRAQFSDRYPALEREFAAARGLRIRRLAGADGLEAGTLAKRLEEYRGLFPEQADALEADIASLLEKRIRSVHLAGAADVDALSQPLAALRALAPPAFDALAKDRGAAIAERVRALGPTAPSAAAALLDAGIRQLGDGAFAGLDIRLPLEEITEGRRQLAAGRLSAANELLAAARRKDPAHAGVAELEAALKRAMAEAEAEYGRYVNAAGASRSARDQEKFDRQLAAVKRLWSDNPDFERVEITPARRGECSPALAGHGARRVGTCWDLAAGGKGPLMVVVPAGGNFERPFAISKYEISGRDYNAFCKATGRCEALPRSRARLPLTGISVADAEAYAGWLSAEASRAGGRGVVYRLPTEAEWEHAANAAGAQPDRKYNCRVTAGGDIIAGHSLIDAASGEQNGWGLANYVGNAQEWVRTANGLKARGGGFGDPLARCDISNSRDHDGGPDASTGFRLVRELG